MNNNPSQRTEILFRKKTVLLFGVLLIVVILVYFFGTAVFHNRKIQNWGEEVKPFTDSFLELLMSSKYDQLCKKYCGYDTKKADDIKKEFEKLYHMFGNIKSYEYAGPSSSFAGEFGPVTSFYMNYRIAFDTGRTYEGDFDIAIDIERNRPDKGRILGFGVASNLNEDEMFYVSLFE